MKKLLFISILLASCAASFAQDYDSERTTLAKRGNYFAYPK
jgi:hypothetical protein